jgi:hypothetical protein
MACVMRSEGDDGYATAAAMMVALASSIAATAILAGAVAEQRAARAQLERTTISARMNGLQLLAAGRLNRNSAPGRLQWSGQELGSTFTVLAEPEADKAGIESLQSDPSLMASLSPLDPAKAEAFLRGQALVDTPRPIAQADASPLWRACAPSLISYVGRSAPMPRPAPGPLREDGLRPHAGEVWRVMVRADGWSDERLVRLTGNSREPGLTLNRTLGRDTFAPCPLEAPR